MEFGGIASELVGIKKEWGPIRCGSILCLEEAEGSGDRIGVKGKKLHRVEANWHTRRSSGFYSSFTFKVFNIFSQSSSLCLKESRFCRYLVVSVPRSGDLVLRFREFSL